MEKHIYIVLVETSHPGNIGAAARAMKTMGLSQLRLVAPQRYPHPDAKARASGADGILTEAGIFDTLEEALADCTLVFGTTARERDIAAPVIAPPDAAQQIFTGIAQPENRVALVFGNERAGLTNSQTALCHQLIKIPTNPEYSSLNLASAVQVLCYELRRGVVLNEPAPLAKETAPPATAGEMEGFYTALEKMLVDIDYLDPEIPKYLMPRLRRLFNRARVDQTEYNILRGIVTAVEKKRSKKRQDYGGPS
ncbi:MAG TPA: RNA methyltransferase [Gammaproteobacteria bacterium]|nr:RNA methyltransferase [Gammaproteobacteria bacterium]